MLYGYCRKLLLNTERNYIDKDEVLGHLVAVLNVQGYDPRPATTPRRSRSRAAKRTKRPGGLADAVISDPPFGITNCDWDTMPPLGRFWDLVEGRLKPTANVVLFGCGKFTVELINSKWYRYDLVWKKNNKTGFLNANLMPMRNHESILIFGRPGYQKKSTYNPQKTQGGPTGIKNKRVSKSSVYDTKHYLTNYDGTQHPCSVLSFDSDKNYVRGNAPKHPTQKPVALMEWLVKTYTNEYDTVIDPFMGSGTTGMACAKLNRRFIGIEKEKQYFDTAAKRICAAYQ